jgi:hypothetical protein
MYLQLCRRLLGDAKYKAAVAVDAGYLGSNGKEQYEYIPLDTPQVPLAPTPLVAFLTTYTTTVTEGNVAEPVWGDDVDVKKRIDIMNAAEKDHELWTTRMWFKPEYLLVFRAINSIFLAHLICSDGSDTSPTLNWILRKRMEVMKQDIRSDGGVPHILLEAAPEFGYRLELFHCIEDDERGICVGGLTIIGIKDTFLSMMEGKFNLFGREVQVWVAGMRSEFAGPPNVKRDRAGRLSHILCRQCSCRCRAFLTRTGTLRRTQKMPTSCSTLTPRTS